MSEFPTRGDSEPSQTKGAGERLRGRPLVEESESHVVRRQACGERASVPPSSSQDRKRAPSVKSADTLSLSVGKGWLFKPGLSAAPVKFVHASGLGAGDFGWEGGGQRRKLPHRPPLTLPCSPGRRGRVSELAVGIGLAAGQTLDFSPESPACCSGQAARAVTGGAAARAARRIRSAARSAIMIVGALVLIEVTVGITEASTTLSSSSPCTRRWSSTTAVRPTPESCRMRGEPAVAAAEAVKK